MSEPQPMEIPNPGQDESTLENQHPDPEPPNPVTVQQGPNAGIFNMDQDFPRLTTTGGGGSVRPGIDSIINNSILNRNLKAAYLRLNEFVVFPIPVQSTTFGPKSLNTPNYEFLETLSGLVAFAESKKCKENWSIEFISPSPLKVSLAEFLKFLTQLHNETFGMLASDYYHHDVLENFNFMEDYDDGPISFQDSGDFDTPLNQFLGFHLELEAKKVFPTRLETTGVPEPIFLNPNQVKIKDDIIESLTCPVCYAVCFPPFSHCENLHFLCSNCTEILIRRPLYRSISYNFSHRPNCPTCKSEVVGLKADWMEGVHEELQFRCGFPGCGFIANGMEIKKHMDCSCPCRTWKCHFCPTILCSGKFAFHMVRAHNLVPIPSHQDIVRITFHGGGRLYENGTFKFPIKRTGQMVTYKLYHLKYTYGAVGFILYQLESPLGGGENSRLMWIPCLIGSEDEAKKYKVKFGIEFNYQSKSSKFPKYTACLKTKDPITVHVTSIQKDIREMIIEYGTMYKSNQVPNDIYKMEEWIPSSTDFGNLNVEIIKSSSCSFE